jgi:hypothetical protein
LVGGEHPTVTLRLSDRFAALVFGCGGFLSPREVGGYRVSQTCTTISKF